MKTSCKWRKRFLNLANEVASWSKDPDSKVGCVLVSPDGRQIVIGYNGLAAGLDSDTNAKELYIHAELNALLNAKQDLSHWMAVVTRHPCVHCASALIQARIGLVYIPAPDSPSSKWYNSQLIAESLFTKAGVIIEYQGENHE